mmetsp:Transcript_36215/g.77229  ORF Transcript_36215/g.77229 Transcript_36215/m.77229 type:complete len:262 (-) Transcript_36215:144-929(-)|eukprot:CAMPEP_0183356074 /NCGR_PEP_ID=MMETSP0164_2-20130417/42990_1 /TAXON_ID=221442 /ORGANISM="Coccolithus pelagicus ssp braarudi, Strain PLY182g" /LENGTH=261 /DNA_ID=CAMNT_0025529377 /DNA_START=277 /DNA_END=1062 /DNA_ORIENTATION=-
MPVATEQKEPMDLSLSEELDLPPSKTKNASDHFVLQEPMEEDDTSSLPSFKHNSPSPVKLSQDETVIIFDWDDTLLASSFLSSKGYRLDDNMIRSKEVDAQLKLLETSISKCLTLALQYGEVHIITNAEVGWVELSARKFLPGIVHFLEKVTVLSARSTYESMYPDAPLKWKFCAFQHRLGKLFQSKRKKNVISFGDSHVEREAVRAVTRGRAATKTKSVKFAERPSMEQLRRQLELVTNCFQYIYSHDGDLDLMLTISLC